jgi:hypothetical protein
MVMMTKAELGCEMSKLSFTLQPKGREAEEAKAQRPNKGPIGA